MRVLITKVIKFLQECTFIQLLYLWSLLGLGFGSVYYLVSLVPPNDLIYFNTPLGHGFLDFLIMIYFSFLTLTAASPSVFIPMGILKLLTILEIFCGLVVFGLLISKLVSTRQEKIIEQLYDVSFKEKVDKMRSMLYFYRTNISRIVDRVKVTSLIRRSDIIKLESSVDGLNNSINDVKSFLIAEKKKSIIKIDDLTLNLLFNSLNGSVFKINEILKLFNEKKCNWKKKTLVQGLTGFASSVKDLKGVYEKEQLKEDLRNILKNLDESLKQLEVLIK